MLVPVSWGWFLALDSRQCRCLALVNGVGLAITKVIFTNGLNTAADRKKQNRAHDVDWALGTFHPLYCLLPPLILFSAFISSKDKIKNCGRLQATHLNRDDSGEQTRRYGRSSVSQTRHKIGFDLFERAVGLGSLSWEGRQAGEHCDADTQGQCRRLLSVLLRSAVMLPLM